MNRKASRVPKYPSMVHLMTRGTHYDVGYTIGVNFSERIKLFLAESDIVQDKLFPFYDSQAGRDYFEESLRVCQDSFPQYVREVRGTADGAGIPFEHVFMTNVSKEVYNVLFDDWQASQNVSKLPESEYQGNGGEKTTTSSFQETTNKSLESANLDDKHEAEKYGKNLNPEDGGYVGKGKSVGKLESENDNNGERNSSGGKPGEKKRSVSSPFQENYGCSDVFINRPGCKLVVHNEDCDPKIKPYGYLLSAVIEKEGEGEREEFTSFCYPGFLPGCAFSYNSHGLTISINGLYCDHILEKRPSRYFVNRSLLRARDIDDAVRLMKNEPYGMAYGFCANISTKDGRMASVEIGPERTQSLVHVQHVSEESDPSVACHYYHFNSYKQLKQVSEIKRLLSSTRRTKRAEELSPPRTLEHALTVLADTEDPMGPIFRTPRPTDLGETVCTAAFDVSARQVLLYQGRDDLLANAPFAKLPMYQ